MKKIVVIVSCLLLMGCTTSPDGVVREAASSVTKVIEKNAVSKQFFEAGALKSIQVENNSFYGINEWYNNDTVIYSIGDTNGTSLYLHNIYSGQEALFFQTENFLVNVKANSDYTKFAIHTVENNGKSELIIVNHLGNIVYTWSGLVDEVQFNWNPYNSNELILTTFLPFLEFEVAVIDVSQDKSYQIPVKNPFVQWINQNEIGYLNWNQNEPNIDAPLFILDLERQQEEQWIEHIIMFFSLNNTILTISVDDKRLDHSLYSFYEVDSRKKIKELYIPIINTFSEAWWIPSYDFDGQRGLFYFMEPRRPADITEYEEGYSLKVISLEGDKEEVLTTVDNNLPIKLSPDGRLLLFGQQYEQVIEVSSKQIHNLTK